MQKQSSLSERLQKLQKGFEEDQFPELVQVVLHLQIEHEVIERRKRLLTRRTSSIRRH